MNFGEMKNRLQQTFLGDLYEDCDRFPYGASVLRARRFLGRPDLAKEAGLIAFWANSQLGDPSYNRKCRWPIFHERITLPDYLKDKKDWKPQRSAELERYSPFDPYMYERDMLASVVLCQAFQFLGERALLADETGKTAKRLVIEGAPVLQRQYAGYAEGIHPLRDLLATWVAVQNENVLAKILPLVLAIVEVYSDHARHHGQVVLGRRFPFYNEKLVSASAYLARTLIALGMEFDLMSALLEFVAENSKGREGFADIKSPADLLTTYAGAELLGKFNPDFDLQEACLFFGKYFNKSGGLTWFGPESPWLSFEVLRLVTLADQPFHLRFEWPQVSLGNCDRKTGIASFGYFVALADLFSAVGGIAESNTGMVFIDLAGFKEFNNSYGQDKGDEVLELFALEINKLPGIKAIRDGGDEFLLVGAPQSRQIEAQIENFRSGWPATFTGHFGKDVPVVAPRFLLKTCKGNELRKTREILGRAVGQIKDQTRSMGPEGRVFAWDKD